MLKGTRFLWALMNLLLTRSIGKSTDSKHSAINLNTTKLMIIQQKLCVSSRDHKERSNESQKNSWILCSLKSCPLDTIP